MINIIIVDDHDLFRKGLKAIFKEIEDITVIAEASNGKELLEIISYNKPQLVLLDIKMPLMNGIDTTKAVLKKYPDINILILSQYDDSDYYNQLIELGVKGFVLKNSELEELLIAIRAIAKGNTYFSQSLLVNLLKNKNSDSSIKLTKREKEIITLLAKGYTTEEIKNELFISFRTVEQHKYKLLIKTNTKNSLQLLIYSIKNNLINIQSA